MKYMLGLSTVSFLGALDISLESKKRLLDFAAGIGLDWVEIRDSNAILTPDEGQLIVSHANSLGLEVSYAIQVGLLDDDFPETLSRGLDVAQAFTGQGPETLRVLGSNIDFASDSGKIFWTDTELESAASIAVAAARKCADIGLRLVVENAMESFFGEGSDQRGFSDLLDAVPEVGWQFDTANVFSASRRPPTAKDLLTFIHDKSDRLAYLHLKSSVENEPQPILTGNPLAFDRIISEIKSSNVRYLCIELTQDSDLNTCFENHSESLKTLGTLGLR